MGAAVAEWGKARVSYHEGRAFKFHFGHGWRSPSVIRLLKVRPATKKYMTSLFRRG